MEFEKLLKERYSCRNFNNKKVEKELLEKILESGRLAPSAKNLQPTHTYIIENNLERIDKVTPCRYNSKTALLICSDKDIAWTNTKEDYSSYEMDATIAATHMILEATNLKINSIWVRMFNREEVKKEFNLKENIIPICFIFLGYTDDDKINPLHNKRKELKELVTYL